jgi:hypothetical protein
MQEELLLVGICTFVETVWDKPREKCPTGARPDSKYVRRNPKLYYTVLEYSDWVWIFLSMAKIIGYEVD